MFQLPPCDADLVLQAVPATQAVPPRLLSDVQSSGNKSRQGQSRAAAAAGQSSRPGGQTDEEADLEAAMLLSLAETSGAGGGPANIDNDQLARVMEIQRQGGWGGEEDSDLEMALRMSQQDTSSGQQQQGPSEEDEIQRAIALSLEGGAGVSMTGVSSGQDGGSGWGARLRQQEQEEERQYKEKQEQEARKEEEELQKALAMSMDTGPAVSPPAQTIKPQQPSELDPVHTAWPKVKNPAPGTLAGPAPAPPSPAKPPAPSKQSPAKPSQPSPGPSKVETKTSEQSSRPSLAAAIMPEGKKIRII